MEEDKRIPCLHCFGWLQQHMLYSKNPQPACHHQYHQIHDREHAIRLQPFRRIRVVLLVAISIVFTAAVALSIQTYLMLVSQKHLFFFTPYMQYRPTSVLFQEALEEIWESSPRLHTLSTERETLTTTAEHDFAGNKLVLILDFWERMINIQSGLRRLVHIGVDAGFTVVEPFIYESKVTAEFSLPEHFERRNMTPQTAALYFRTKDLYSTNRYISHSQFKNKIRLLHTKNQSESSASTLEDRISSSSNTTSPQYVIQAAIHIDWTTPQNSTTPSTNEPAFQWCDERFAKEKRTRGPFGWSLGHNFHVQRVLCLSSSATVSPTLFTARLFHDLFRYVRNGTTALPQQCRDCTTLAFLNYRKHAFTGFVSHTGLQPFRQQSLPLAVGDVPRRLAARVRRELLGARPHVAVQMRTGKTFVALQKADERERARGRHVVPHEAFRAWLRTCTRSVAREARRQRKLLGRRTVFYVASDMYNDGWKGGERCPTAVCEALEEAKRYLDRELKSVFWFKPEEFGVSQDVMGMAGLTDAAVCLGADRFVYARPSNFGKWVDEQRVLEHVEADAVTVDCVHARFSHR